MSATSKISTFFLSKSLALTSLYAAKDLIEAKRKVVVNIDYSGIFVKLSGCGAPNPKNLPNVTIFIRILFAIGRDRSIGGRRPRCFDALIFDVSITVVTNR